MSCRCWPSAWEDGDRLGHLASARGPWSQVRPHVRLSEGHRPPDKKTYGPRNIYPYLRILKTFSGFPVTYVRTCEVSSRCRAYSSGPVVSTRFCLADEAFKEKTITQRCSMYVCPFLFGLKNQLKEARGHEAPTPLVTDQLSSCSYYCLSRGGAFHGTVWNSTYVCPYPHTYVRTISFSLLYSISILVFASPKEGQALFK